MRTLEDLRMASYRVDVMGCLFCGRDLEPAIRQAVQDSELGPLLAWWADDSGTIQVSGLSCQSLLCDGSTQISNAHYRYDIHASNATGARAIQELARIADSYMKWDTGALRRLITVCRELSSLPKKVSRRGAR